MVESLKCILLKNVFYYDESIELSAKHEYSDKLISQNNWTEAFLSR